MERTGRFRMRRQITAKSWSKQCSTTILYIPVQIYNEFWFEEEDEGLRQRKMRGE